MLLLRPGQPRRRGVPLGDLLHQNQQRLLRQLQRRRLLPLRSDLPERSVRHPLHRQRGHLQHEQRLLLGQLQQWHLLCPWEGRPLPRHLRNTLYSFTQCSSQVCSGTPNGFTFCSCGITHTPCVSDCDCPAGQLCDGLSCEIPC